MKRVVFLLFGLCSLVFKMAAAPGAGYDVNGDGEVNIGDINAVIDAIFDATEDSAADVNVDGEVNIADINTLIDVILSGEHYHETLTFKVGNSSFKMVKVDGGTFTMGNNSGKSDEMPTHEVTLSSYYIGETEVTQAVWVAAMGINRSFYKGYKLPVDDLLWDESLEFIDRINVLTGYRFSLPTEAQWEYAARGGKESKGYTYAGSDDINEVAWYRDNCSSDVSWTLEVATKQPNELGLYDMSGNVAEWCMGSHARYPSTPQVDPVYMNEGSDFRVFRGGSRVHAATDCRVTARRYEETNICYGYNGMRLALQDRRPVALGVSEDNVEMLVGDVATVSISNGKGSYQATSSDHEVVRPSMMGATLYIRATGAGTATITITDDQSDLQAQVLVRVGMEYNVAGVAFKMMPVEGGTFMMGNTDEQGLSFGDDDDRCLVHEVTLSSYCIGQTEVTQELWTAIMGYNPSGGDFTSFIDPQGPVENMSWDECQEFIARLNELTGLTFRLPTEAEWEFAARGGNRSRHYRYSGSRYIEEVAWYHSNAGIAQQGHLFGPQAVGLLLPNELGLYDMSGNVRELCQDWYGGYSPEPQTNPTGPATGTQRVLRGGCFDDNASYCSCAMRRYTYTLPFEGGNLVGFRLALSSTN